MTVTKGDMIETLAVLVGGDPDRSAYLSEVVPRLWPNGLAAWLTASFVSCGVIRQLAQDRLTYNLLLDGFTGDSSVGIIAWSFHSAADGRPLLAFMPALVGDTSDGIIQPKMSLTVVERDPKTGRLTTAAGAPLKDAEAALTITNLRVFAERILKALDDKPKGAKCWNGVFGGNGGKA
jgi:hypothetical protein